MGWTNFVIVPSLNIAIEISRYLQDLEDYEERAFKYLASEEFEERIDIENRTIRDLTVRDLATLFTAYDNTNALKGLDHDKLRSSKKRDITFYADSIYR